MNKLHKIEPQEFTSTRSQPEHLVHPSDSDSDSMLFQVAIFIAGRQENFYPEPGCHTPVSCLVFAHVCEMMDGALENRNNPKDQEMAKSDIEVKQLLKDLVRSIVQKLRVA